MIMEGQAVNDNQLSQNAKDRRKSDVMGGLPIEFNAQRLMELEIPLQRMEQKVEQLENEVMRMNTGITDTAIKLVCEKINEDAYLYLPKFSKKFTDLKQQIDTVQKQMLKSIVEKEDTN